MHQFEFIDPDETLARNMRRGRHGRATSRACGTSRELWRQMQDLPRHLGQHSGGMVICQGELVVGRAARERQHARPRRRAVGQGRLRRHGHHQGRSARPRHDGGAAGRASRWSTTGRTIELGAGSRQIRTQSESTRPRAPTAIRSRASAARRSARSTRCCSRPTRSACSRSSRARRWRRCRGSSPTCFYDLVVEVAIIRPGPDRRADGASVSQSPRRPRAGDLRRIRCSSRC